MLTSPGLGDPSAVEAYFDRYFTSALEQRSIPGAAFAYIYRGEILFAKGYGFADLEARLPVDPRQTRFRIASLTKLFTAAAVLQLAEEGRLHLDADVNRYLRSFRIPKMGREPVTARHLLTHTGGFDERLVGVSFRDPSLRLPLSAYLSKRMPPRVAPPGRIINYSNHGFALLGHLIEEITGRSYERYIEENILSTLGMSQSGFDPPLERTPDFAVGYDLLKGRLQPVPIPDHSHILPAGGLLSTAADMGRFLLALSEPGLVPELLPERALASMHRRQHSDHPELGGVGLGFFESTHWGQRALSHTGGAQGFGSLLYLLPDHRLGFYFSTNRLVEPLLDHLPRHFLSRFFPRQKRAHPKTAKSGVRPSGNFAGTFRNNRYAQRTIEKLIALRGELKVGLSGEQEIALEYPGGIRLPVEPSPGDGHLLRSKDRGVVIGFRKSGSGRITHLLMSSPGMTRVYERIRWFEGFRFQTLLGAALLILTLLSLVPPLFPGFPLPVTARWLSASIAAIHLGFAGLLILSARDLRNDYWRFGFGLPPGLRLGLLLPVATTPLTLALGIVALAQWLDPSGSLTAKVYTTTAFTINAGFLLFLRYWNLYGKRY